MKNKTRVDGLKGKLGAFKDAQTKLAPPDHCDLLEGAESFFDVITASRAASMWNDVDLARAVNLANIQYMLNDEMQRLAVEGMITMGGRNGDTEVENPRVRVVGNLQRLEISLSKALQTDAASTVGRSRDNVPKNKAAKEAREELDAVNSNPILASMMPGANVN